MTTKLEEAVARALMVTYHKLLGGQSPSGRYSNLYSADFDLMAQAAIAAYEKAKEMGK